MSEYNPEHDYCGPEGLHISKYIPRKIGGVDINYACYVHDKGWAIGKHTKADWELKKGIYEQFSAKDKKALGFFVSWLYFTAVRLGRLTLWIKGVR